MEIATRLAEQLTLHQLRLLVAVADRGGVTRAAEALGVSQPAVSHQLAAASRAVGLPLVETIGRRTSLTAAGQIVVEHARRVLAELDDASTAVDELRGLRGGTLRVAGDTTVGTYVLPDVLGLFRAEHPGIRVVLEIGNRRRVLDHLVSLEIDFAVSGRPWDDAPVPLVARPFLENDLVVIASPHHHLAGASSIQLVTLAAEPLIYREAGSGTRATTEEVFRTAGLEVRPVMELATNGAIKRAVAQDLGVAVISRYAAALELELGRLVELPVEGFPRRRLWHLFSVRDRAHSPTADAFAAFVEAGTWRASVGAVVTTD